MRGSDQRSLNLHLTQVCDGTPKYNDSSCVDIEINPGCDIGSVGQKNVTRTAGSKVKYANRGRCN
jgi:hypothetical protein